MARLKFLVFSVAVLGLWAANLFLLSPALSARAVEETQARTQVVPEAVRTALAERRLELQGAALKVASNAAALAVLEPGKKVEAPTLEQLKAFRAAIGEAVPKALHSHLVVALSNEAGVAAQRGEEPVAQGELDLAALTQAGGDGVARDAFGQSYFFYSIPVKQGFVVLGAPLVADGMLEAVVKQTGAEAAVLLRDGKVLQAAGAKKAALEKSAEQVKLGPASVLERGAVANLGPVKLPMLTVAGDTLGGNAALTVASRQALPATPFEVVSSASTAGFMGALAAYQQTALFIFVGLLLASIVFTLLMGGAKAAAAEESEQALSPAELAAQKAKEEGSSPELAAAAAVASDAPPPTPIPEAGPDDFQFANSSANHQTVAAAQPPPPPSPEGFFDEALPPAPPAPALQEEQPTRTSHVNPQDAFAQFDHQQTMAYPSTTDPFELASRQEQPLEPQQQPEFNPDATRVAAIPEDLLRASARAEPTAPSGPGIAAPRMSAAVRPPPVAASTQSAGASSEEAHFQEVFRDFVRTREQCGEAQDGLTFEKFAQKLRKNREQLVAKYNCKTVRFQVYVKEGKAALKATPIKE